MHVLHLKINVVALQKKIEEIDRFEETEPFVLWKEVELQLFFFFLEKIFP